MRIAIIGWGSLIWDPRELPRTGSWHKGGPRLPIAFSRVSIDQRLTLVIDHKSGTPFKTRYIQSSRTTINDAIEDLRQREGTTRTNIAYVDLSDNIDSGELRSGHKQSCEIVRAWLAHTDFRAHVKESTGPTQGTD
jgi:hypothetical protein